MTLQSRHEISFADFWELYPRKQSKRAAEKAWHREIKAGADPREIIEGLRRQLPGFARKDKQFIPHPSTWLNQARWEDEDMPYAPSQASEYRCNAEAAHSAIGNMLFGDENGADHDETEHSRWH